MNKLFFLTKEGRALQLSKIDGKWCKGEELYTFGITDEPVFFSHVSHMIGTILSAGIEFYIHPKYYVTWDGLLPCQLPTVKVKALNVCRLDYNTRHAVQLLLAGNYDGDSRKIVQALKGKLKFK